MDCNCIRGEGSFMYKIDFFSKDSILYQDLSNWNTDGKYKIPDSYVVTITPPDTNVSYNITINTKCYNKITKDDFGGFMKDGIYCIKFKNCDKIYTGYFAITNKLNCCYEKMIINNSSYSLELRNLIEKINIAVKFGNFDIAKEFLKIANEITEFNKCNC